MSYENCFTETSASRMRLVVTNDDQAFAVALANSLREHPAQPPTQIPSLNNALQGNLCEYCIWELGEIAWQMYEKRYTWPANATSPWRRSSDPGIDILAILSASLEPYLLVVEVKSSQGDGSNLVYQSGSNSSLKADVEHLFSGNPRNRLASRVGTLLSDLKFKHNEPQLAASISNAVGYGPKDSSRVKLLPILICDGQDGAARQRRTIAFANLDEWLIDQGWEETQFEFRCIELQDFNNWLDLLIRSAVNVSLPTV